MIKQGLSNKTKRIRPQLKKPSIYVRIRPDDESENGGHAIKNEESVEKKLHEFTQDRISISDSHKVVDYTFPSLVFPPESTQGFVYDETIPSLLESFTQKNGYNVLLYAYGQTGTGKTHTIFGSSESLKHTTFHEDWGIVPRICHNLFEMMENSKASSDNVRYILQASAIEFYLMQCFDLLTDTSGKVPCCLDNDSHEPVGQNRIELSSMEDLFTVIDKIDKNRTTAGTKMNEASSRGHCALILSLYQIDMESEQREVYCTNFHIVDLAGAERPNKSGVERFSGTEALMELFAKSDKLGEVNPGAQALLINFELSGILSEIRSATVNFKKRGYHNPPLQLISPGMQYLSACFDGRSLLGLFICLSQAPQNGWETWFSMEKFGSGMAKLRAPAIAVKGVPIDVMMKNVEKNYAKFKTDLDGTPEFGSPKSKYYAYKKARVLNCNNLISILNKLG